MSVAFLFVKEENVDSNVVLVEARHVGNASKNHFMTRNKRRYLLWITSIACKPRESFFDPKCKIRNLSKKESLEANKVFENGYGISAQKCVEEEIWAFKLMGEHGHEWNFMSGVWSVQCGYSTADVIAFGLIS
jgi:hypothetical protein